MTTSKRQARDPRAEIARLDLRIARLRHARRDAVAALVDDMAWQDVPVVRIRPRNVDGSPGDRVHVLEQVEESSGYTRVTAHDAQRCPDNWCRRENVAQRTPHRRGRGYAFTFRGTWQILATPDPLDEHGEFICIPQDALASARATGKARP
ncbi:hypothetical protein M2317_001323 [Microbacterium sp. ZKA21]|uniref:hypothetical protein n=1 Tax=Microbacterium sp. ZKA21 TaxID=3381694 RepID=UPI003D260EC1